MGGKKKKKNRMNTSYAGKSGKSVRTGGTNPSVPSAAQDKYAKYAGAVSNKSKRNYADLRLVSPSELRGNPVSSAPSVPNGGAKKHSGQSVRSGGAKKPSGQPMKSGGAKKPSGQPVKSGGAKKPSGQPVKSGSAGSRKPIRQPMHTVSGNITQSVNQQFRGGKRGNIQRAPSKPSKPHTRPTPEVKAPVYADDEYSRALNNSDFYGDLVEKYYIKYPEKQEERKSAPGSAAARERAARRKVRRSPMESVVSEGTAKKEGQARDARPSIAELAVRNRGTDRKKQYAKVVKTGKAKGSIPTGSVHRKVRRINRQRSLFLYAASAASVVAVLCFLFFFWGFKVKQIVVEGETPYSDNRITSLCDFTQGDNLMFIDTAVSERQVVESLPYVETCKVKRAIPHSVEVNVTCAVPLGVAEAGSAEWVIVSTSGKILESVSAAAVVSGSDLGDTGVSTAYTAQELAAARKLPVLVGLEMDQVNVGSFVNGSSVATVNGFACIYEEAQALGLTLDKLKYTDRGYEAEYDGRINIVLGDTDDRSIIRKRLEIFHHIMFVKCDISEHERGEITYLKNQIFFDPTYDFSEEELARYAEKQAARQKEENSLGKLGEAAVSLLDEGVSLLHRENTTTAASKTTAATAKITTAAETTTSETTAAQTAASATTAAGQ